MVQGLTEAQADALLDQVVEFEDDLRFERLEAITNFRKDDGEARILYSCRRVLGGASNISPREDVGDGFVMKVKVQVPSLLPGGQTEPVFGPAPETVAELKALQTFTDKQRPSVPHLITWKRVSQGPDGLFPGGYIAFTVMTRMPGENLLDLGFWSMPTDEQAEIRVAFKAALQNIWRDGFEPYDCALRNILWKRNTKQCSIVDFEHYHPAKDPINMDETAEMQKWGLMQRPPPSTWWAEWGL